MPNLTYPITLVVIFLSWSLITIAHSTHAPLLKRAVSPRTVALEVIPRHSSTYASESAFRKRAFSPESPHYDDTFRLTIAAFDDVFHLHLRPNDHLIHPAARVNYMKLDAAGQPVLDRTEPLLRTNVRAYLGEVVAPWHTDARWSEDAASVAHQPHPSDRGWARIVVHRPANPSQGISPLYEGAFSANGVTYHIATKDNYIKKKHPLDSDVLPTGTLIDDELVIWRESDHMTPEEEYAAKSGERPVAPLPHVAPQTCGHDNLRYNYDPELNPILQQQDRSPAWLKVLLRPHSEGAHAHHRYRRQNDMGGNSRPGTNFKDSIGQTRGCPTSQKIIYMGVAADCEYVKQSGGEEQAKEQILTTWNTASAIFKSTFNVSLGITELLVQPASCPTAGSNLPWNIQCAEADLSKRLSLFSQWRGTRPDDGNGLWHLMSGCPGAPKSASEGGGSNVGIAWLGTICRTISTETTDEDGNVQFVSGAAVSTAGRTEWQVVAHEIGHNFGAIHDCRNPCSTEFTTPQEACCPLNPTTCDSRNAFIMASASSTGEKQFSPCSLGNVCTLMAGGVPGKASGTNTGCLVDPDSTRATLGLQMCGNGIVEPGEDCDPGLGVTSPCCDSATCKFTAGSVCDYASSACCTTQCSFAPATQICRGSMDPKCDFEERCTGNSSACPKDEFKPNGESCGEGELACAAGKCTSIAQQCKELGASENLSEPCPDRSDSSCKVTCQSPGVRNQCTRLSADLVDGSPCGWGGTCLGGKCQPANWFETAKAWYTGNLQISIPVTVVVGLIVLLILWGILSSIRRCCCGSRTRTSGARPISMVGIPATAAYHRRLSSRDPSGALRNVPPIPPRSQYARVPPAAAHDRSRSQGGGGEGYDHGGYDAEHQYNRGYNNYNYGPNERVNWVDDRTYNGTPGQGLR